MPASPKENKSSKKYKSSFTAFITQPWIAAAFLIFAFVTLILSLHEFISARGI